MSHRPLARLAGLSLAGVFLLGCDVTDTPNHTGQRWLEETGVTLPEPFTIRVPLEVDSLGAENSDSRILVAGAREQYAGSFADLQAEWRAVYRPGGDGDWPRSDSTLRRLRATEGDWALRLVVDSFARDKSKELRLRLRLDTLDVGTDEALVPRQIDQLVRFNALPAVGLDTIVTVAPNDTMVWRIQLPQAWSEILRSMRNRTDPTGLKRDSSRIAVFSLSPVSATDSGMARIVSHPYLRIPQTVDGVVKTDSLLPTLQKSKEGVKYRAYATRIAMPALAKDEPVLYAGPRWRNLRVKIDTAKFRAAVRAALPPAYRDDPRWSDPFGPGMARYSVLGARLAVNLESVTSEGGRKHPLILSSRGDSVTRLGTRDTTLDVEDTVVWKEVSTGKKIWTMKLKAAGDTLLLIIVPANSSDPAYIDTLDIDAAETSPVVQRVDGATLVVQRLGNRLRVRLEVNALRELSESQADATHSYSLSSLVAPDRTTIDLQARTTFSRVFANPGRSIELGLSISRFAYEPSSRYDDLIRYQFGLNSATFVKARLADKPLGEAVILLQPLGSKGRN